ncbi:dihydrofolate reductase family protein [Kribbella sp. NPDC048928]|uniref:dihydrofolate reductase family protein n=1 Tax=Kribbella sp. NPDC048928 TaxID=3364111 RepID=UPI003712F614
MIRLYMSMSLDGFVVGPDDSVDEPMGRGGFRSFAADCAAQAKEAAGDRDVMVHGAGAAQALLRAGLLDELELHVVNVLLGQGRRLFDNLPAEYIELENVRQLPARDVTHLRYRVVK